MQVTIVQALNKKFIEVQEELARDFGKLDQYDTGFEEGYLAGLMYAIEFVKEIVDGDEK